jgi:hypothetical protein
MNAFLGKPVTMERLRQALATATGPGVPPPPVRAAPPPDGSRQPAVDRLAEGHRLCG